MVKATYSCRRCGQKFTIDILIFSKKVKPRKRQSQRGQYSAKSVGSVGVVI